MDQIKIFKVLTVVLLVANVALMSFILFANDKKGERYDNPLVHQKQNNKDKSCDVKGDKSCKKDCQEPCCANKKKPSFFANLNLDSTQQVAFDAHAETYKAKIKTIREDIKANMKDYFSDLKTTNHGVDNEALMEKIQGLQKEKLELTHKHFETLKALLKEEQKAKFDTNVDNAMKCILAKNNTNKGIIGQDHQEGDLCHKDKPICKEKG